MLNTKLFSSTGGKPSFFILSLGGVSDVTPLDIAVDSNEDVVVAGDYASKGLLFKVSSDGNLLWENSVDQANGTDTLRGVAVDSSNNIYAVGDYTVTTQQGLVQKYNSNGNLTWSRGIELTGVTTELEACCVANDDSKVYFCGRAELNLRRHPFRGYLDSSGGSLTDNVYSNTVSSASFGFRAISFSSDGFVWTAGEDYSTASGGLHAPTVERVSGTNLSTSRSVQITYLISSLRHNNIVNTSDNGAIVTFPSGFATNALFQKITSSLTVSWSKRFQSHGVYGCAVDSSDNIFLALVSGLASSAVTTIVKLDPSGTLIWARSLSGTGTIVPRKLGIDSSGKFLYLTGYETVSGTGVGNIGFVAKLPTDGSKAGVYGPFTYQTVSKSVINESATPQAPNSTFSALTRATTNVTVTVTDPNLSTNLET